jgi:hypothetical protein
MQAFNTITPQPGVKATHPITQGILRATPFDNSKVHLRPVFANLCPVSRARPCPSTQLPDIH